MLVALLERSRPTLPWVRLYESDALSGRVDGTFPALHEGSELQIEIGWPPMVNHADVEIRLGNVLVASSRPSDRADFPVNRNGDGRFVCRGRLLRDWVGITELLVDLIADGRRHRALAIERLPIAAGKLTQEAFEELAEAVAGHSTELLLDVYGKTYFGLEPEQRAGEMAPTTALRRLHYAVGQLSTALRDVARRPASRLRPVQIREPALLGQSINELTLHEVCTDPTLAVRARRGVRFREQLREAAATHFDLPENRALTSFIRFLRVQIADLRLRTERERQRRLESRAFRDRPDADGGPSWWEREDKPRIAELEGTADTLARLDGELAQLLRVKFLPPAPLVLQMPAVTPLFRSHRGYAMAYQVMFDHFRSYRVQLDGGHLLVRARSLPVLYEYWCVLEMVRLLRRLLRADDDSVDSPFRRRGAERERVVVEFDPNQSIDFFDAQGRRVRLRYTPRYRSRRFDETLGYGLLGAEPEMTPDITLEIGGGDRPEQIIVFDAKYSSVPHSVLLDQVRAKYGRIGEFVTGRILSRQVWALSPLAPGSPPIPAPAWAGSCTIDNLSFWSDRFDTSTPIAGAIHARPRLSDPSPLEQLLRLSLTRAGLRLRG